MTSIATSPVAPSPAGEREVPPSAGLDPSAHRGHAATLVVFAAASFTGAALLFAVQPMVAKMLLPLLGGSAAVWNTAMVFFQAVLLAGYAFAHVSSSRLAVDRHRVVQVVLVALALLALPIAVPAGWTPPAHLAPATWMLLVLVVAVGGPFFVLATVSPTLQRWFSGTDHPSARDPYFLYAAGNAGSLLALVAYPLVLEPRFDLRSQAQLWTGGYVVFGVLCVLCALRSRRRQGALLGPPSSPFAETGVASPAPSGRTCLRWAFISFVPSALMLGVTRHLSTDIAAVPLLWVLPLALYLLSFVLAFGRNPVRLVSGSGVALRFLVIPLAITMAGELPWVVVTIVLHLAGFFAAALLAHARLAADRPDSAHLTRFYLWLSVGGVLGGIFAALVAPVLFDRVLEYPIALVLALVLVPIREGSSHRSGRTLANAAGVAAFLALVGAGAAFGFDDAQSVGTLLLGAAGVLAYLASRRPSSFAVGFAVILLVVTVGIAPGNLRSERTFFGVYRVLEEGDDHVLLSGTTVHGRQRAGRAQPAAPLDYYAPDEPIGQYFRSTADDVGPNRVGVIGLGSGALAYYGRAGDQFDFYEIDPTVVEIASDPDLFTYLADSRAAVRTVIGDGRLALRDRSELRYDLLVLDAFSSDAIPIHLLTQEALALYLDRLAPSGVVALHISNRYFDLAPILARHRSDLGLTGLVQRTSDSAWVFLAPRPGALAGLAADERWQSLGSGEDAPRWTDSFSDLLSAL